MNNLNAESSVRIWLHIVISIYDMIEHIKYLWKCKIKSDIKIETKIRDKSLKGFGAKYSKSEMWWMK